MTTRPSGIALSSLALCAILAVSPSYGGGASTHPLYNNEGGRLTLIDPASGAFLTLIGNLTGLVDRTRGLAIDPLTRVAYLEYEDLDGDWRLGTVDLATAAVTDIGDHDERFRELAFDSTGKLWGVSGQVDANSGALLSIDTNTGATTLENGSLPTVRNKLAYAPGTDTLYILGQDSGTQIWELYSLSPAAPMSLTQIALSGINLDSASMNNGGMVFDPVANVLLTEHQVASGEDFLAITPGGLVTSLGNPSDLLGLAFFPAQVFADGFESGDTTGWSSTVGAGT